MLKLWPVQCQFFGRTNALCQPNLHIVWIGSYTLQTSTKHLDSKIVKSKDISISGCESHFPPFLCLGTVPFERPPAKRCKKRAPGSEMFCFEKLFAEEITQHKTTILSTKQLNNCSATKQLPCVFSYVHLFSCFPTQKTYEMAPNPRVCSSFLNIFDALSQLRSPERPGNKDWNQVSDDDQKSQTTIVPYRETWCKRDWLTSYCHILMCD